MTFARVRHLYIVLILVLSGVSSLDAKEAIKLPDVVVTATRVERELFETPQAVTVIDSLEIEEANVASTPDLFNYAEGVYIQKTNLGGGSPFIRGLTGKQVLILIDGIRLNNSFYRFGPHQYLNTIDPNTIERIEVVRGPGSVLYGSDALGGVINIITRRRTDFSLPKDADALLKGLYDTAVEGGLGRAQGEGNIENFGVIGGVTGKTYNDLEGGGDVGKQVPSGYDEFNQDLKLNWRPSDSHEIILAEQYTRQYDVPKTSEVTLGDKLKFNYEPQKRGLAYIEYRGKDMGVFDYAKLNVSYNGQEEGEEIIKRSSPSIETKELTDVETIGAIFQFTNLLGKSHRLTYGLDYYRDDYETSKVVIDHTTGVETPTTPGVPDGAFYKSLGLYLQDEIRLGDRSDVVAGLRYSRYETEGTVGANILSLETDKLTGSLNLLYRLTPGLNVVGGVAQGFRAPNMEDFFGRVDFFSEIPNTQLKPEESLTGEIGLKYYRGSTFADLYYYISDYEDLIERVTVGTQPDGTPIKQRRNIKKARIQGVEAGISHQFNRHWGTTATLSWTKGEDRDTGEPLRRIPPFNGTFRLRYIHDPKYWIQLDALLADEQDELSSGDIDDPRIPEGGTPGYAVFSLKGGYKRVPNEQLLLTFENITDKKYKSHGSGIFAPGRSIILSYQVWFD